MKRHRLCLSVFYLGMTLMNTPANAEAVAVYVATPLTAANSFTEGIEGPAVDYAGNVYAVNFQRAHTIGKVTPAGSAEVFATLPGDSIGSGIRVDRQGQLLVADYVRHTIYRIDPATGHIGILARDARMNQPNDLAITADDILYASDPNWKNSTGNVWRINTAGRVELVAAHMGTTNGIDISPDGNTLYVNESVQRSIWAFAIEANGSLSHKRLFKQFDDFGLDGMRVDVDGNLYVTRYGKGTVVKLAPDASVLQEIATLGSLPSNICFGGPDGRTAYVTEVEQKRIVQFRVERPGLEWARTQANHPANPPATEAGK
jgi:sugar lactone lactonase YvrE